MVKTPKYEVEEILDKRTSKNGLEYKIKWKNWDILDSTWETADRIQESCRDLIRKFERKRKQVITKPKFGSRMVALGRYDNI